ncbi:MAG: hypothetical protein ABJN42_31630 [Roseibium sp.]|uniref:hypothetical protein n=1 Tax=Roseibium sp. TaxID=1936156 RepID=UPI00329802FD
MSDFKEKIEAHLMTLVSNSGDVELFPREDWQTEVENGDTDASHEVWLETQIEIESDNIVDAIERLMHQAPRAFMTDGDEIAFNEIVLDVFGDLRMLDTEAPERARKFLQKDQKDFIYGETAGVLPDDLAQDMSRLAHLGMVAYEARTTPETIDGLIIEMSEKHNIDCDAVEAAKTRLGADESPSPM